MTNQIGPTNCKSEHSIGYKIFKYPLLLVTHQKIVTYKVANVLHVGMQRGSLCMWCLVDLKSPIRETSIYVVGTGHSCNEVVGKAHYGTVLDGAYVWHVFGDMPGKP
jgi:hypothetical protein